VTLARALVPAGVLAGLAVALAVAVLLPETYRATGVLVLSGGGETADAAELLSSRGVAESAAANLRLDEPPKVDVGAEEGSALLRYAVEDRDPEEASRVAQEVASVFTVLYNTRFGGGRTAAVWEAPRAGVDPVSPRPALLLALGALAGGLAGVLGWLYVRRGRPAPAAPAAEGPWTIAELERLAASPPLPPERRAELARLVEAMREFAGPAGTVPRRLDQLVRESFGELLTR
jgi:uncharacterized protein involved in exopolysaccharide biosynthesis